MTLELAWAEAQAVLARQLDGLRSLDEKASKLMTAATALLSLLLAALAVVGGLAGPSLPSWPVASVLNLIVALLACAGVLLLTLALCFCGVTHLRGEAAAGLGSRSLATTVHQAPSRTQFLVRALETYELVIENNERLIARAARSFRGALVAFLMGMGCATLGAMGLIGLVITSG